ncbi:dTDP-4-dehydrorhamnose 3,5-epimerase [Methylophilaceae bacterium]|nr:dTDP-4-dehydrorhamnose 3,5-epimerase [Methylophilaceae bacterium]
MKVTALKIPDVKLIEPEVFEDERGYFFESFNQKKFNEAISQDITFVQDNQSKSKKGVLRGLHYQEEPFAQGKLVRAIKGEIFDVAVDIRKDSSTYGQWVGEILSEDNRKQLWIPEGFAHGFLSIASNSEVLYKVTNHHFSSHEKTIAWNNNSFAISWPINTKDIITSLKDC